MQCTRTHWYQKTISNTVNVNNWCLPPLPALEQTKAWSQSFAHLCFGKAREANAGWWSRFDEDNRVKVTTFWRSSWNFIVQMCWPMIVARETRERERVLHKKTFSNLSPKKCESHCQCEKKVFIRCVCVHVNMKERCFGNESKFEKWTQFRNVDNLVAKFRCERAEGVFRTEQSGAKTFKQILHFRSKLLPKLNGLSFETARNTEKNTEKTFLHHHLPHTNTTTNADTKQRKRTLPVPRLLLVSIVGHLNWWTPTTAGGIFWIVTARHWHSNVYSS